MIELRLTRQLYKQVIGDLDRSHPFAAERVGFLYGRPAVLTDGSVVEMLYRYESIPNEHYVKDPHVGARIGSAAINGAMQTVFKGQARSEGAFHVHLHGNLGPPGMSTTDRLELPPLIPGFQSVGTAAPHGIVILSRNHGTAWVWLPGETEPQVADRITVVGAPIDIFERRDLN